VICNEKNSLVVFGLSLSKHLQLLVMAMLEIKFIIMVLCAIGMINKFRPAMYSKRIIANIEGGKIVGENLETFYAFRGINYAEAPVGDLRFATPKPYSQKWEGLRNQTNYSAVCAQYDHFGYIFEGSEDCLTLNVFVPKSVMLADKTFPVIFFIHGEISECLRDYKAVCYLVCQAVHLCMAAEMFMALRTSWKAKT
jgi:Carboxylesterase family